jgi:transcriptional regulator with GAF, ATPase, and Fis domain
MVEAAWLALHNDGGMKNSEETSRFRLLYNLACAFASRIELDELIPHVMEKCREVMDAEGASVLLLDPESDELYFPYVSDEDPEVATRLAHLRFPAGRGIAGEAIRSGHAVKVDDAAKDSRFYGGIDEKTGLTTRSLVAAPLISHKGPIGVVEVINRRTGDPFTDDDQAFIEALAGSVAVAIENARLYGRVKNSEQLLRTQVGVLRRDLARQDVFSEIIGASKPMMEVFALMESAAASWIQVLIQGETGTGKELVARGIHRASGRSEAPFIAVNCAAVPETLLESELFGHRQGAFTGAVRDQPGLFRAASGGVIFLDEVGDMPLVMQAKLLRVLEQGEVVPVGETMPRKVDVRVISATNRDLKGEVTRRTFREDLYYRMSAFPIKLPPLRERPDDIPLLAARFLTAAAERHHRRIDGFQPGTVELLMRYEWPGNVRELQNEIERSVALARENDSIGTEHFSTSIRSRSASASAAFATDSAGGIAKGIGGGGEPVEVTGPLRDARGAFEARYIAQVLRQHDGNVSHSARSLGISRVALQKKMKEYLLR